MKQMIERLLLGLFMLRWRWTIFSLWTWWWWAVFSLWTWWWWAIFSLLAWWWAVISLAWWRRWWSFMGSFVMSSLFMFGWRWAVFSLWTWWWWAIFSLLAWWWTIFSLWARWRWSSWTSLQVINTESRCQIAQSYNKQHFLHMFNLKYYLK